MEHETSTQVIDFHGIPVEVDSDPTPAQGIESPLQPIWDGMSEFELMRGALEETVTRLGAQASLDHEVADDVIDVAVMTMRLSELVERAFRDIGTAAEILQVQSDTNALMTSALKHIQSTLVNHDARLLDIESALDFEDDPYGFDDGWDDDDDE